jgi:hypothetical protein
MPYIVILIVDQFSEMDTKLFYLKTVKIKLNLMNPLEVQLLMDYNRSKIIVIIFQENHSLLLWKLKFIKF